jgi:hypothetical protein
MSPEIRKTTNCDSNTKGLSYGLLDYVFNLPAGRNIGLKMSKQWPRNPRKNTKKVQGSEVLGSRFRVRGCVLQRYRVQRLQPLGIDHHIDKDPEYRHTSLGEKAL